MSLIKKNLAISTILVSTLIFQGQAVAVGPAGNAVTGTACTHSGGALLLRSGAGTNFKKLASIPYGSTLVILDSVNAKDGFVWYKVRFGKKIGYSRSDYVCGL